MLMMRALSILFVVACLAVGNGSRAADSVGPVPVLVELFTSEGCSSCPPADAWLQQIDAVQPVPGARLIVLSEHVDYWNHDGWKDPYSSASITERQGDYVRALRLEGPATPQVVVDGTVNLPLGDAQQIRQTLQEAAATPMVPVRIVSAAFDPGNSAVLRARIEVDGTSASHKCRYLRGGRARSCRVPGAARREQRQTSGTHCGSAKPDKNRQVGEGEEFQPRDRGQA